MVRRLERFWLKDVGSQIGQHATQSDVFVKLCREFEPTNKARRVKRAPEPPREWPIPSARSQLEARMAELEILYYLYDSQHQTFKRAATTIQRHALRMLYVPREDGRPAPMCARGVRELAVLVSRA